MLLQAVVVSWLRVRLWWLFDNRRTAGSVVGCHLGGQRHSVGIGYAEQMSSTLDNENAGNSLTAQRISGLFFSFGWLVGQSLIFELNSQMIGSVFPPIVVTQRCKFEVFAVDPCVSRFVAFICYLMYPVLDGLNASDTFLGYF